jgi:tetratricopeptide (TPR) repeat protein
VRPSRTQRRVAVVALVLAFLASADVRSGQAGAAEPDDLARARGLIQSGSLVEAVRLLRELVERQPEDADTRLLLGTALALLPRRSEALEELQAAIRLRPDSAPAHDALGMAYSRFVEPELARRAFVRAVELDPNALRPRVHLALTLAERGETDAALRHLSVATESEGEDAERGYAHYVAGLIHSERDAPQRAAEAFEAAAALDPADAAARVQLGLARARLRDSDGAIAALERAVALAPKDPRARYQLGRQLLRADRAREAVVHLEAAVEAQPRDRATLYSLVRALRVAGRAGEAGTLQARLRELTEGRGQGDQATFEAGRLNNAGIELEAAGRLGDAVERYRSALELDPLNSVFRRNLALALCRMGEWSECARELEEVLRLDPNDEQASRALYIALEKAAGEG